MAGLGATAAKISRQMLAKFGTPLTFRKTTVAGADDGSSTATTATWAGSALRVKGEPKTYETLGLVEKYAPTLLWAPNAGVGLPEVGARCTWGGQDMTVKDVDPLEPDGTTIHAKIVIAV